MQRELVVGYKSIYINVYSVFVIDIKTGYLAFRHESFCLWETKISSFLNQTSFDYITMEHSGLQVLALGKNENKQLLDNQNYRNKLHSLKSCHYLKLDS